MKTTQIRIKISRPSRIYSIVIFCFEFRRGEIDSFFFFAVAENSVIKVMSMHNKNLFSEEKK